MSNSRISIAHVGRKVGELTGLPAPSSRKIYDLTLRNAFPAIFINGRWFVAEGDIPKVAEALGMQIPADQHAA